MIQDILEKKYYHTYNGGWMITIGYLKDNKHPSILIETNSFGDISSSILINSGENQNPLTKNDLCRIGTIFHNAAAEMERRQSE